MFHTAVLLPLWLLAQQSAVGQCGVVTDESGTAIEDALIIVSHSGFGGWTFSAKDGTFCLKGKGQFLNVRHVGFNPIVQQIPAVEAPIRIRLVKADGRVKTLPLCSSIPSYREKDWIGSGLRVKPPRGKFRGPVNGGHDTHWYVRKAKDVLHLVDGVNWHSGLPYETLLSGSKSLNVRGWEFQGIVGLDLSGILQDGRRWRWVGAPLSEAISYENASVDEANYFDEILKSPCYVGR